MPIFTTAVDSPTSIILEAHLTFYISILVKQARVQKHLCYLQKEMLNGSTSALELPTGAKSITMVHWHIASNFSEVSTFSLIGMSVLSPNKCGCSLLNLL